MTLKDQVRNDMKAALLGGSRFEGDTLRNLMAAILNEEVATNKRDEGLEDAEVEKLIAREVKKRGESISMYEQNDRADLAENEQNEIAVLEKYMPEQLSEADVRAKVDEVVAGMGEVNMQQIGQIIGAVKAQLGNSADGALIAKVVKEKLTQ